MELYRSKNWRLNSSKSRKFHHVYVYGPNKILPISSSLNGSLSIDKVLYLHWIGHIVIDFVNWVTLSGRAQRKLGVILLSKALYEVDLLERQLHGVAMLRVARHVRSPELNTSNMIKYHARVARLCGTPTEYETPRTRPYLLEFSRSAGTVKLNRLVCDDVSWFNIKRMPQLLTPLGLISVYVNLQCSLRVQESCHTDTNVITVKVWVWVCMYVGFFCTNKRKQICMKFKMEIVYTYPRITLETGCKINSFKIVGATAERS